MRRHGLARKHARHRDDSDPGHDRQKQRHLAGNDFFRRSAHVRMLASSDCSATREHTGSITRVITEFNLRAESRRSGNRKITVFRTADQVTDLAEPGKIMRSSAASRPRP